LTLDAAARTAAYWDAEESWRIGQGLHWLEIPAVQRRLNQKVSGRPEIDWVRYTLAQYFADRLPVEHCLNLGCGRGWLERQLASLDAFVSCDAFDIAPGVIAQAEKSARQGGHHHIRYTVQDANQIVLPTRSYHAVWSAGAVHHFERLEHVFEQVAAALKPEGLFVLHEYVGPNRFQFPAYQRDVIQACLGLLPQEYRQVAPSALQLGPVAQGRQSPTWLARRVVDKLRDGDLVAAVCRRFRLLQAVRSGKTVEKLSANLPTERSVVAADPSEAVRSAEIIPLLRRYFHIVEFKPQGGTILQFLLADIAGNFADEIGGRLLEMLFTIEDTLMETGRLQSDFAYIVAAPREGNGATRD